MSCPFFEPLMLAPLNEGDNRESDQLGGRLPLVQEYDGLCHSGCESLGQAASHIPLNLRRNCCNMGNANGVCPFCPQDHWQRSVRFTVTARSLNTLDLLCVEEEQFAPLHLHRLTYSLTTSELLVGGPYGIIRTQATAFCKSYLSRFQAVAEARDV